MQKIKPDTALKLFFKNPIRVADLLNSCFFHGHDIVFKADIIMADGEESHIINDKTQRRYRDSMMQIKVDGEDVLIAIEHQMRNDPSMVLRSLEYDYLSYRKQWDTHPLKPSRRILKPVITFVIHWGNGNFHGKKELCKIVSHVPKTLDKYYNNYEMNFVDIKDVDVNLFHDEDVRSAVDLIQRIYKAKRKNYKDVLKDVYVNKEVLSFVSVITNIEALYEMAQEREESEMIDMCQAFKELMRDCREEGIILGKREGQREGKEETTVNALQNMTKKLNISLNEAMDILEVPYKQRERIQTLVEV